MGEKQRKFKGVWIPKEIWLSSNLSIVEKCLLTEIDSLDNENGCTAGNSYFAKFFGISPRQISKYIGRLEEKKYVKIESIGRNRRRVLMEQKFRHDGTKVPSADGTKVPHNNTVGNNTENTIAADAAEGKKPKELTPIQVVVNHYLTKKGWPIENNPHYSRNVRAGKDILKLAGGDPNVAILAITRVAEWADDKELDWALETVVKRWYANGEEKKRGFHRYSKEKGRIEFIEYGSAESKQN